MNIKSVLEQIGLSQGEINVYLALLKLGSVNVNKIKLETKLHRTTIYDFLDKLINKGLVSYVIKNNVNYYQAAEPEKLLHYTKEMQTRVKSIMPKLKHLRTQPKEEVIVEVYKGVEGFKSVLNDMLRSKANLVWLGVDEAKFNKTFSKIIIKQHVRRQKELGIHERLITSDKTECIYDTKTATYRYIPEKYFEPTPTAVYADRVMNLIWEPLTAILMRNKDLANSYKKHFEQLWKIAKKEPLSKIRKIRAGE
ncbi:helix-turn-helix domain-containing protein [Candidatus Woesearchaeota archaeon]|nr:helix-turn-helix domain-containing protein [Candidatus Woesearchaeota archaeon]